jgi:hypothetical protein
MRIRWLLIIWALLATAVLLIRFVAFGPSEALGTAYALLSLALIAGFGAVLNQRVRSALRAADPAAWEHTFPNSGQHGGGPPALRCVSLEQARAAYGYEA